MRDGGHECTIAVASYLIAREGVVIGKSFFNGRYTRLYNGSAVFSAKINSSPELYGLSALQASSYAALHAVYAEKYLAAANRDHRSPVDTLARNDAAIPLKAMAVQLASIINSVPSVTNEQKLELGLSVRKTPEPVTQLGTPDSFKVELQGNGALLLKWKCASPRATGMTYQVYRRIGPAFGRPAVGNGDFVYLGGVGEKKFLDDTLPAGTAEVTYQVRTTRSKTAGNWAQFNVNFTAGRAPAASAASSEEKLQKMAA